MKKIMEGSHAIAEAVRLSEVEVISAYPITPQTHIVERLSEMVANGEINAEYIRVESEHSAMASVIGSTAAGVRSYTATSSAGLALMHEMLGVASGMRLPIVMNVSNRSLSSPLGIWNDWSDAMSQRDMGWIQLYCENAQEALDTTIQAYKIAEKLLTPVMVCIDGFYISHTYEPVEIPESLKGFLPKFKLKNILDPDNPVSLGDMAGPDHMTEFKYQQAQTMEFAKDIISKVNEEFSKKLNNSYGNGLLEEYNMENAKYAIVTMGSIAGTIKHFIDVNKIEDVGLVRLKSFRPFPFETLQKSLKDIKSVGVLEKHSCPGIGGNIWAELKGFVDTPVSSFIGGLGGRDIQLNDIEIMFNEVKKKKEIVRWLGLKTGDVND